MTRPLWGSEARFALGVQLSNLTGTGAPGTGAGPGSGVLVTGVTPGSIGDRAGIRPGDVIVHLNGYDVLTDEQVWGLLAAQPLGSTMTLDIWRAGHVIQLPVSIGQGR
jgi:S1-C subfamily serine protease